MIIHLKTLKFISFPRALGRIAKKNQYSILVLYFWCQSSNVERGCFHKSCNFDFVSNFFPTLQTCL